MPRQETEFWTEKVIKEIGDRQVRCLDIFSGSGCVGVSVLANCHCATLWSAEKEKKFLESTLNGGKHSVRVIKRAQILLKANKGLKDKDIAAHIECDERTVRDIRKKYCTNGLEKTIYDAPHPGCGKTFTDDKVSKIIAIACTDPPEERDCWTLKLLCQKTIDEGIAETISPQQVCVILQNHGLKPHLKKNVVVKKDILAAQENMLITRMKLLNVLLLLAPLVVTH